MNPPVTQTTDLESKRRLMTEKLISPLSAGMFHYGIIDEEGKLYMTGKNDKGQLGNGTITNTITIPQTIPFNSRVINVSCGYNSTGAVTEDGSLYLWGANYFNIIPNTIQKLVPTPQRIDFHSKVQKVTVGVDSVGVITKDNSVYYWGNISPEKTVLEPEKIPIKGLDILIGGEGPYYAVLGVDGKVYMWGYLFTDLGQFLETPKEIPLPELIQQVCLGDYHVVALSREGNVYTWGDNSTGQLALSSDTDLFTEQPEKVNLPKRIASISSEDDTVAAVTVDGELYMWGDGRFGEIDGKGSEYGEKFAFYFPLPIDIGSSVNYVSVGGSYTIAVTKNRVVNYWGRAEYQPKET